MEKQQYKDFDIYCRALIASKDVDPTYPVVKHIIQRYDFEPEWFVFCYVAFYNLETAIKMCTVMDRKEKWNPEQFRSMREKGVLKSFGHERRGTARNIDVQINMFNNIVKYIGWMEEARLGVIECPDWDSNLDFRQSLVSLPNHGDWAAFKIAELFEKSLDYKAFIIQDLGLEGRDPNSNDGPVSGLRWLYGRDNVYDASFFEHWNKFSESLAKSYGVCIGEIETCLCKWHKMKTGKYFIGHDIQEFVELEFVMGTKDYEQMMSKLFDSSFWKGVKQLQKQNKTIYKDKGHILNAKFATLFAPSDVLKIILDN